jgi:REP element-mobilizing transposase RayT
MSWLPRRRKVPHWEHPGGTVCITWRLDRGQAGLRPEERDLTLAVIGRGEGVLGNIIAAVVMDDHAHVHISLFPSATGQKAAQVWKSVSAHGLTREFGRSAPVWQRQYFDRWIMDDARIERCAAYVRLNPERRWPGIEGYRWVLGR